VWPGWGPATVFPQSVGLGATWNDGLLRRVGDAVAQETRAMRARDDRLGLNVWAPTVSLLRLPLWGRNEEGYAEDPHLTAAIATAYTRRLRGDDPAYWMTAPVLKRWPAHNNETDRSTSSSSVRPRVLHEYDMRAFRRPVEAGAVAGVMPAYNLVNGRPNHVSPYLREHLRTWTDQETAASGQTWPPINIGIHGNLIRDVRCGSIRVEDIRKDVTFENLVVNGRVIRDSGGKPAW
jgi:beta-glucosidase